MVWKIKKVRKNEKIEWNGMVEMSGANKGLAFYFPRLKNNFFGCNPRLF